MRREDLLPPAVADLIAKIHDPNVSSYEKDNVYTRLDAIERATRSAIKTHRKAKKAAIFTAGPAK